VLRGPADMPFPQHHLEEQQQVQVGAGEVSLIHHISEIISFESPRRLPVTRNGRRAVALGPAGETMKPRRTNMSVKYLLLVVGALFLGSGVAHADPTLKAKLSLSMEQAKQVDDIQKKYRKPFAAKRTAYMKEMRALRRANIANDSAGVARQEKITAKLREDLRVMRKQENDEIRAVLTPAQREKFEQLLADNRGMHKNDSDDLEL